MGKWELMRTATLEQAVTVLNRLKVTPKDIVNFGRTVRDYRTQYELLLYREEEPKKGKKVKKDEER